MKNFADFFIGLPDEKTMQIEREIGFSRLIPVKTVQDTSDFNNLEGYDAVLIDTVSKEKLRQFVDKAKSRNKLIIVKAKDDSFNRSALETKKISVLLSPENQEKADFMAYRNSGLNQVLCKIAEKNKVSIGISFSEILSISSDKILAERIGRIMQNIMICRKYKTKIQFANFSNEIKFLRSASDLRSFGLAVGMTPEQANKQLI
jgi:RNase P/RNase MRP subunit p30